jgi:[ribosomal protein S5]-alanine N-acetyltransferase
LIETRQTPRLTIRPIRQTDAGLIFALNKSQDPGVVSGLTPFKNLEAAGKYVAGLVGMNKTGFSYHWVIEDTVSKQALGFCNVYLPAPHLIGMGCCEISFALQETARGQGIMHEALVEVIKFITQQRHFFRIEALVSPTNPGSQSLLAKLGFKQEGLQRQKMLIGQNRFDMQGYALLATEFSAT